MSSPVLSVIYDLNVFSWSVCVWFMTPLEDTGSTLAERNGPVSMTIRSLKSPSGSCMVLPNYFIYYFITSLGSLSV